MEEERKTAKREGRKRRPEVKKLTERLQAIHVVWLPLHRLLRNTGTDGENMHTAAVGEQLARVVVPDACFVVPV